MEVNEFLKLRTAFIRRFYETAAEPFLEIICLDDSWFGLPLVVTREALYEAIKQVESLTAWMEEPLHEVKWGRR